MKKLFQLTGLAVLVLTTTGWRGRSGTAIVPEKSIVAAYFDFGKSYNDGKYLAKKIIRELPSELRGSAQEGYERTVKEIDKVIGPLNPEWVVIAFGGNRKSLYKDAGKCVAFAAKINADEDTVANVLKEIAPGGKVSIEKKDGNVIYVDDKERTGLVDGKYLVGAASEEAFDEMFDLYAGKGQASEEFDDLSRISGNTACRISTAPISSLLKRFELTKYVEEFGEACEDKELVDMILNMGSVSLDLAFADGGEVLLRVECDSPDHAEMVDHVFQLLAFASRVTGDALLYAAKNENGKSLRKMAWFADFVQTDLFKKLIRSSKASRSGKTAEIRSGLISSPLILAAVAVPNFIRYRNDSQTAACVGNMQQLRAAGESWLTKGRHRAPTVNDLCGLEEGKYLKQVPFCPKDGSGYTIRLNDGAIEVKCGSGDPDHVLPGATW